MKINFTILFIVSTFFLSAQEIDRFEPSNWWVGMEHSDIQVLVYGKNIASTDVTIDHEAISLNKVIKVKNPNYLFLYISIDRDASAATVPFVFKGVNKELSFDFELLEREHGRSTIEGFDASDVMYLITPDRFANGDPSNDNVDGMKDKADRKDKLGRHGGDVKGMLDNLDYIVDMGFTSIWINPIIENNMTRTSYHGYAATDFYQIDKRFGTNQEYRDFCSKAGEKGVKIIMDMIMNHCGSEHWFVLDPPMDDWLNFQDNFKRTSHRRTTVQDIYASEYDKRAFADGWFVKTMPDLNQRNPLMADYLIINTIWWIEYSGISGIRMDTYPYPDKEFMNDWTCAVMTEYPGFNIVAEEWTTNPAIVSYWQRDKINHDGYTSCLPSMMDFPIQDAVVKGLIKDEAWNAGWMVPYEMLCNDFLYADPYNLVIFPDNHDMDRFYTQIGGNFDLFKMGMVYFSTMRGIPQFYYGTEILMNNDIAPRDHGIIRTDFPGGWEGDKVNAFTGAGLNKKEKEAQAFTKKLLNWRKESEVIHYGKLMQFAPFDGIYAYFRYNCKDLVMVVFNKNDKTIKLDLDRFEEILKGKVDAFDVINDTELDLSDGLKIDSRSALILEIK